MTLTSTKQSTKLLVNGRVHSPTHPDATAMAVRGDVVAWLGSDDVGRSHFPDAEVQDLDGGFVAPGFVDSHIHLSATGLTLSGLDLRPAGSRAQCIQLVADYAAAHPDQPVWGHGWDESAWPDNAPPSTSDLDAVLGDRPAYLARVDVHSALASTGLRRLVPDRLAAGPLTGDAHHLVRAVARDSADHRAADRGPRGCAGCPGRGRDRRGARMRRTQIGGLDDWLQLRALDHGVEVIGYWGEAVTTPAQARALMAETGARGLAGDLFVDGALGSHTAWLHRAVCGRTGLHRHAATSTPTPSKRMCAPARRHG